MIEITLWQNQDQEMTKFLVQGHSAYGKKGWDIVCSAVSALTLATVNGLTDYVKLTVDLEVKDGYVSCQLPHQMEEEQKIQAQAILNVMDLAFQNIENQYQEYIGIERINL